MLAAAMATLRTQTISVQPLSGADNAGQPTWGALVTTQAIVDEHEQLVETTNGMVMSTHKIAPTIAIAQSSRVFLAGADTDDDNEAHHPIMVSSVRAAGGDPVYEVLV